MFESQVDETEKLLTSDFKKEKKNEYLYHCNLEFF